MVDVFVEGWGVYLGCKYTIYEVYNGEMAEWSKAPD